MKRPTQNDMLRCEVAKQVATALGLTTPAQTALKVVKVDRSKLPDYVVHIHVDGKLVKTKYLSTQTKSTKGKARTYTSSGITSASDDLYMSYVRPKDFIRIVRMSYSGLGLRKTSLATVWRDHAVNHSRQWVITKGKPIWVMRSIDEFCDNLVAFVKSTDNHPPEGTTDTNWFLANEGVAALISIPPSVRCKIVCTIQRINR